MGSLRRGMMAGGGGGGVGDPYFANVVSLLHFDGANGSTTFTDVTGRAWTAQNSADIRTDVSKFGGASGWFQNTPGTGSENGSRIMTPDAADLQFGTGDFTVEGWFIPQTPLLGLGAFYRKGQNTADGLQLAVTPTQLTLRADSSTDTNVAVSLSTSTWSHIAFTRQAGLVRFFVNGDLVGSAMRTFNHTDTEALFIGSVTSDTRFSYRGRIDDLRITKGVARYTAAFSPPTAPFPNGP